jgi:hypothetical protein
MREGQQREERAEKWEGKRYRRKGAPGERGAVEKN